MEITVVTYDIDDGFNSTVTLGFFTSFTEASIYINTKFDFKSIQQQDINFLFRVIELNTQKEIKRYDVKFDIDFEYTNDN